MNLRDARMSSLGDKIEEKDKLSNDELKKKIKEVKKSTPEEKGTKSRSKSRSKKDK